jgi:hypothetical protein
MTAPAQVPILQSVGAAPRFVMSQWRSVATFAAFGALATAALAAIAVGTPFLGIVISILTSGVQAAVYTLFIVGFLSLGTGGWLQRALTVWGAMIVIAFFLFIVLFVISFPATIVLFAGPLGAYTADLQAAGTDQDEVIKVMVRFVEEQPGAIALTLLFFGAVWMYLTSRLYLAAPATAEQGRVLTFETWKWTKGATLRIIAARLMLLAPAYVLVTALAYVVGGLFGIDAFDPASLAAAAQGNVVLFLIYVALRAFATLALYSSLEAGLSSYLYRGLKPVETASAD